MSKAHVDSNQVLRFERGASPADEVLLAGRHLAECEECSVRFAPPRSMSILRAAVRVAHLPTPQVIATLRSPSDVLRGEAKTPPRSALAPAAVFREIDEAERRFTNDHLLRGILYARAGVQRRAEEELELSNHPAAPRLLRDVRNW